MSVGFCLDLLINYINSPANDVNIASQVRSMGDLGALASAVASLCGDKQLVSLMMEKFI